LDRIEHFLLSLSVSDLIFGVVTLGIDSWYLKTYGFVDTKSTGRNINTTISTTAVNTSSTEIFCSIAFNSVFLFSILASVFHVMAIAVERLCVIKFPKKYFFFTSFTFKSFTIFLIWMSAVVLASFCVISLHLFDSDIGKHLLGSLLLAIASLVFVIDMIVVCFLLRQKDTIADDYTEQITTPDHRLRRETVLFFFMGISFVACILPIALGLFDKSLYHPISSVMITLNSLINPCMYFAKVWVDSRKVMRPRTETTHELLDERSCSFSLADEDSDKIRYPAKSIQEV